MASYVIVEKSVDKHGQGDLRDMDDLGDVFRKKSTSRKLIYDVKAHKWILVIKLKAEFENGFFKSAVSPFAMKDLKVYLWSSR